MHVHRDVAIIASPAVLLDAYLMSFVGKFYTFVLEWEALLSLRLNSLCVSGGTTRLKASLKASSTDVLIALSVCGIILLKHVSHGG